MSLKIFGKTTFMAPIRSLIVSVFFVGVSLLLPAASEAGKLDIHAHAAVLMDASTGRLLWQRRQDLPLAPASTTKILTALVALERSSASAPAVVPAQAIDTSGRTAGLRAGERLPVEQLLYAMMLFSANDAAITLAHHAGGSVPQFVALMNQRARALGALRSNFRTPTGLPHKGHLTTAVDLAVITRAAMRQPTLRAVVGTRSYLWRSAASVGELKNSNLLLESYPGAVGVKTGQTREAGFCLVAAAERGDRLLIAVILKSNESSVWSDAKKLLDHGFSKGNSGRNPS
jgi:D-alanyl-D-alanine carboxypeptidase (penicillin-binding protein 5/6)